MPADAAASRAGQRVLGDARGPRDGPTLVVIGGLHANEPSGLVAGARVHAGLSDGRLNLKRGRLLTLRGNLAALLEDAETPWLRRRYIDRDLNRLFDGGAGGGDGSASEYAERAALVDVLADAASASKGGRFLIDLHTVSSDSPGFVAFEDSLPARRFVGGLPLPKIIGIEEHLSGLLIDFAAGALGYVSCIVEAGRHDDPLSADVHEAIVLLAMHRLGLIDGVATTASGQTPREVVLRAAGGRESDFYDVRERVPVRHESFRMRRGRNAFAPVRADRTVVADESGRPLRPSVNGLLFMPNRQPVVRPGDDAFFVIRRVGRLWLVLSSWLRRRGVVHRWARMLPGVRPCPDDPAAFFVAPEIAFALRREVFHLLGYRLIRWSPLPHRSLVGRVVGGLRDAARAVVSMVVASMRRDADPEAAGGARREEHWIVRRRVLDVSPHRDHSEGREAR